MKAANEEVGKLFNGATDSLKRWKISTATKKADQK
jgi:hypothetical protein